MNRGTSVIRGAVAIVTGGGSGIGEAIAKDLASRGVVVCVTDVRIEQAERVASDIVASGGAAFAEALDVRDADRFEAIASGVVRDRGRIDLLFNNAGIGVAGEIRDVSLDDFRTIVDINVLGVVNGIAAVYPKMIAQGSGHIVNTASMAGLTITPLAGPYGMTKAAVVSLSRSLRIEAAEYGVRVSVLCPGVIRTPILDGGVFGRVARGVDRAAIRRQFERMRPMPVDRFAEAAIDAVSRNEGTIVVPARWRVLDVVHRWAPSFAEALGRIGYRGMRRAYDAASRPRETVRTSASAAASRTRT